MPSLRTSFCCLLLWLSALPVHAAVKPHRDPPRLDVQGHRIGLMILVEDGIYHSHHGATMLGNRALHRAGSIPAAARTAAQMTRLLTARGAEVIAVEPIDRVRDAFAQTSVFDLVRAHRFWKVLESAEPGLRAQMEQQALDHLLLVSSPRAVEGLSASQRVPVTAQGLYTFNMLGRDPIAPYALINTILLSNGQKRMQSVGSGDCAFSTFDKLPKGVVAAELRDEQILAFGNAVLDKMDAAATDVLFKLRLGDQKAACKKWYQ